MVEHELKLMRHIKAHFLTFFNIFNRQINLEIYIGNNRYSRTRDDVVTIYEECDQYNIITVQ